MNKEILRIIIEIIRRILILQQMKTIQELKKRRNDKEAMKRLIEIICEQEGVDKRLGVAVALCESGLNPDAVNLNPDGSIDRGLFQWNDLWHPEVSDEEAFDPEKATRLFCKAVKQGHLNWWKSSKHCWEKYLKEA